jgi:hypothetical protein
MIPGLATNFPVDGSDPSTPGFRGAQGGTSGLEGASGEDTRTLLEQEALDGDNMLRLAQEAESQGATFFQTAVRSFWARNYRAYRSQHFEGSKYLHPRFSGRSKTFRPKTRDAVRKKMQAAATALFSTGDVVSITPENEADQVQAASAALKQELLNYRLSRETKRNGIKWFLIASGAVQTMQITGLCVSKQSWVFKEEETDKQGEDEHKNEQSFALSQTIPQAPQSMAGGTGSPGATMPPGGTSPSSQPANLVPSPPGPPGGFSPPGPMQGAPPAGPGQLPPQPPQGSSTTGQTAGPPPPPNPPGQLQASIQPPPFEPEKPQKTRIIEDRPDIALIPPENVIFDPNCDWTDPAQSAQYLRIAWPMSADEAWLMVSQAQGQGKKIPFLDTPIEVFRSAVSPTAGPSDSIAARVARNEGTDPAMMVTGTFGRVWPYEWYIRIAGKDYTFWTLGISRMLSKPVLTADAYPEQGGARPLVIGLGAIEAFRPYPMSPVESWQPLQHELNDQVNLRLDHLKQCVSPPAMIKRGADVDLKAVQKRGADRIIMITNQGDVEWAQIPDIPQSAAQQDAQLNSDFDSLAGIMNMGTVQTNRQLNETVGGMNLLAGDASSTSEFDLSIETETWVGPVLNQVMKLEEYYESDETVLAIAGEKARLFQRFGMSDITDDLLMAQTSLTIKVGVGAANLPMQRLQKFQMAAQTVGGILQPFVAAQVIKPPIPNVEEIINTVFGAAGFRDGGDRFFVDLGGSQGQTPDPKTLAMLGEQDVKRQANMISAQKIQEDSKVKMAQLAQKDRQDQAKLELERMRAHAEVAKNIMQTGHDRGKQAADHVHQLHTQSKDHAHQARTAQNSDLMKLFGGGGGGQSGGQSGSAGKTGQPAMPGGTPSAQPEMSSLPG